MSSTTKCTMPGPDAAKFRVLVILIATGVIAVAGILYLEIWIPVIQESLPAMRAYSLCSVASNAAVGSSADYRATESRPVHY